jgi:hypothetical protein
MLIRAYSIKELLKENRYKASEKDLPYDLAEVYYEHF